MDIAIERRDLMAFSAGACLSWPVGSLSAQIFQRFFGSGLAYCGSLQKELNCFHKVSTAMANAAGTADIGGSSEILALQARNVSLSSGWLSNCVNEVAQGLEVSGRSGVRSAFWAGGIETFWSFALAWKGKEPKDMVVCALNGGVRGALIGVGIGSFGGDQEAKALRILASSVAGFVSGMIGSGIGTLAGWGANKLFRGLQ